MQVSFNKCALIIIAIILLSVFKITAQEPDWNSYPDVKERLTAMRKYGYDLVKKQQFASAIAVFDKGLKISKQASLDSFACVYSYLLAAAYRYKSNVDSSFYYLEKAKKTAIQNKYISLQALIQIESFSIFNRIGPADSVAAVVNRMKDILPQLDSNSDEWGKIQMYLGHDEKHKARYTEALEHYYKALQAFNYQNDFPCKCPCDSWSAG